MSSDILKQIEVLLNRLLGLRAVYPYMKENLVGHRNCGTAPFYRHRGLDISFTFAEPLTAETIDEINEIGHWINQNYVVRLYALLESCGVVSGDPTKRIDNRLDGHQEIDILRRLRHEFAHSDGRYDPTDAKEKQLRDRIIEHFSLNAENHPEPRGKFPIPIDKVLVPLTKGCKRYVQELFGCEKQAG